VSTTGQSLLAVVYGVRPGDYDYDRAIADRMIGFSQHWLGDQASAREHIERMLAATW
jgi:hypothetical protein